MPIRIELRRVGPRGSELEGLLVVLEEVGELFLVCKIEVLHQPGVAHHGTRTGRVCDGKVAVLLASSRSASRCKRHVANIPGLEKVITLSLAT